MPGCSTTWSSTLTRTRSSMRMSQCSRVSGRESAGLASAFFEDMGGTMGTKTWGPFTGRQLTIIVVTLIAGFVLVPSAVWAVDTLTYVTPEDPTSGVRGAVDSTHHLLVSGPVSGTVSARPAAVSSPWATTD